MLVDCDACAVRGPACPECLVTVILGAPPAGVDLTAEERRALQVFADAGLVPELRLVRLDPDDEPCGYLPVDLPDLPVGGSRRRSRRPAA